MTSRDVHIVKTVNPHFTYSFNGIKTFEIRKLDRDYKTGDILVQREYEPDSDSYSNRAIVQLIIHILKDSDFQQGIKTGYGILSVHTMHFLYKLSEDKLEYLVSHFKEQTKE